MRKRKRRISKRGFWTIAIILVTTIMVARTVIIVNSEKDYSNQVKVGILTVFEEVTDKVAAESRKIIETEETVEELEPIEENLSEDTISYEEVNTLEIDSYNDIEEYEVELLAHLIMGEADVENERDMYGVAVVAVNRMASPYYPDTLEEVIYQYGQYACTLDGNFEKEPIERCYEIACDVLSGERYEIPSDVLYQAQFEQGTGIYDIVETRFGTHYYCYY